MPDINLTTDRITFRLIDEGDLDFLASMLGDPVVMRHYEKVLSRDEAGEWLDKILRRYRDDGYAFWLMQHRETGEPIGQMGLLKQHVDGVVESEIGYMLHRSFWRQGLASEGACGIRDYAFEELGKSRLVSLIAPGNIASQRAALSYGAKPEKFVRWRDKDTLVFALSKAHG